MVIGTNMQSYKLVKEKKKAGTFVKNDNIEALNRIRLRIA